MCNARCYLPIALWLLLLAPSLWAATGSIALGYEPKYGDHFSHFDYLNPTAPRGGELTLGAFGNFDTLNPFTLKGLAAEGLSLLMFETLMEQSLDEPFSQYALLAESVALAADRLSVTYRLRPEARFNDGSSVTAADVKFSFDTLKSDQAHPQHRFYYADIAAAEVVDERTVRFTFHRENPELHLITGQIPIFSRHWVGEGRFTELAETMPITSGPYLIESVDLGKQIRYRRDPDYWGRELNVRRGSYNFDRVSYKYYRDFTVLLEAFKAGEFDFIHEYNSKKWATDYTGPRFASGEIVTAEILHHNNAGMQGFVMNLRRPLFQDRRVRQALSLAFDFEWSNRNLFYDQYQRCDSYFSNSELASSGLPSEAELKRLLPFKSQLPPELFTTAWQPSTTTGRGGLRANLRQAKELLQQAGWQIREGKLTNRDGQPFQFEVMLAQKAFERILAPYAHNLEKLGIEIDYRTVDVALYQKRLDSFDFDMVVSSFGQSQSPGNELMGMFHSSSANEQGSRNLFGLQNPVVDALVKEVIYAADREALVTATRALDRVLLHGDYLVPHWYIGSHRIAWWDKFERPERLPLYFDAVSWMVRSWWLKAESH
ncbi:ABC transporter substrate-binding protein [Ectothiorhodospiraceae bacterium BW-2]|nr:ABC transporter substrate-binding protein [Ectothiorhodospiraceae bacterium BW-2]